MERGSLVCKTHQWCERFLTADVGFFIGTGDPLHHFYKKLDIMFSVFAWKQPSFLLNGNVSFMTSSVTRFGEIWPFMAKF